MERLQKPVRRFDMTKYGCHNRAPFVTHYKATGGKDWIPAFGKTDCQFTLTPLGQADKRCDGCKWRTQAEK